MIVLCYKTLIPCGLIWKRVQSWELEWERVDSGREGTNFYFPGDFKSRLCLINPLLTSIYFKKETCSIFFFKNFAFGILILTLECQNKDSIWKMTNASATVSPQTVPVWACQEVGSVKTNQQSTQTSPISNLDL